jgi:membrane-associated phospholipid phosphatase
MSLDTRSPEPLPPPSSSATALARPVRLRTWLIFWALIAACLLALLSFNARLDTFLWCSTRWFCGDGDNYTWAQYKTAHLADPVRPFYVASDPPFAGTFFRRTEFFWTLCKRCGEPWIVAVVTLLIAAFFRRRRLLAISALAGMSAAGFLGWLIRSIDGRYRPTHHDGENHWLLLRGFDLHNNGDLSFPSGHSTLVFSAAAALSYCFPRGRPLFIGIACLTAIARVVQEAHFWSDVLFGSALGWTVTWLLMQFGDAWFHKRALRLPQNAG